MRAVSGTMKGAGQHWFGVGSILGWHVRARLPRHALACLSRLALMRVILVMMAAACASMTAWAQAPQEWTATGYSETFPGEPAALAAIQALGGR